MGYEDDKSSDTEAVPRAEPSTGVVDANAMGSVDPKEVHMESKGNACAHIPSEGEYMIERTNQPTQGVLHKSPNREVSDSKIFNSLDCLVLVQVGNLFLPMIFKCNCRL